MPNTIVHIGIQGLTTRCMLRDADCKWILVGCVVPDVPWIMQRIVAAISDANPYDLRLYATVQASFLFCLILSLSLSALSERYWRTFSILGLNAFLHLVLDALETKWGNGVHLIAPFSWNMTNAGLFWPESIVIGVLTVLGFAYFWVIWPGSYASAKELTIRPVPLLTTFLAYLVLPLFFMSAAEDAGSHFVKTLRRVETRPGNYVEIDRAGFVAEHGRIFLKTFAGERIEADGMQKTDAKSVSIQGQFVATDRIQVFNYHVHDGSWRDLASYAGILLIAFYFICNLGSGFRGFGRSRPFRRHPDRETG